MYGTLTMDAVVHALIDRVPEAEEETAPGWRAAHLPGLPYPGLIADDEAEAPGRVYLDLTAREWAVLDAFENPDYVVEVITTGTGRRAFAYVWPAQALDETWRASSLDADETRAYLDRCALWRTRYEREGVESAT